MEARKSDVSVTYNGTVMTSLAPYLTGFSYTDNASDETDSIDIEIQDRDHRWINGWIPKKGDSLSATIKASNQANLSCGEFTLDDFSFSGPPSKGKISGVAIPANSDFKERKRTQTWANATIKTIAQTIANRSNVSLNWQVKEAAFTLKTVEQDDETDCSFLTELCGKYGYYIKLFRNKIIVFSRKERKKDSAAKTLYLSDISSWSWRTGLTGTYTGGKISYESEWLIEGTFGYEFDEGADSHSSGGSRILELNEKCESDADAERIIRAAVEAANHGITTLNITMPGRTDLFAGQNVRISGLGKLSGKYYIDSITHKIATSGGYTASLKLSLID